MHRMTLYICYVTILFSFAVMVVGIHPSSATGLQATISPARISYISCLLNGIGTTIDLTPFKIIDLRTGQASTIPVGTWVVRTVDETGAIIPPDSKGRVLISWKNRDYWILAAAVKQASPDGRADCDGYITPAPTLTPVNVMLVPSPTLVRQANNDSSTELVTLTPTQFSIQPTLPRPTFDPSIPTYVLGRLAVPAFASVFGATSPAVVGSFRFYDLNTLDIVPSTLEECFDSNSPKDSNCFQASAADPSIGVSVYAPVDGCLYPVGGTSMVVLVVLCEHDVQFQNPEGSTFRGRREILFAHLDPTDINIPTGKRIKAGDLIGNLCTIANADACDIRPDVFPYLSVKVRFYTGSDYFAATKEEILALLSQPNCLYDKYLYSPNSQAINPQPLQACPASN
jgi:hypothetical protein